MQHVDLNNDTNVLIFVAGWYILEYDCNVCAYWIENNLLGNLGWLF